MAVRTGAVSGLVVLDIDPGHGGDEPAWPPSSTTTAHSRRAPGPNRLRRPTPLLRPPRRIVRNDAGRRLGPGLDIRGDGGYIIAPPSGHASGGRYHWDSPDRNLPAPPDWLLARLRDPYARRRHGRRRISAAAPSAWAQAALERELARVASAQEGTRNSTLNKASFSLGQIIGGGALDPGEVEALLVDRAAGIGLGEREARATIASGLSAGARQPRGPAATTIDLRTVPLPGTPTSAQSTPPAPKVPAVDIPAPVASVKTP